MRITEDTTVGDILAAKNMTLDQFEQLLEGDVIDTEGEGVFPYIDTMGLGIIPGGKMDALARDFEFKLRKL